MFPSKNTEGTKPQDAVNRFKISPLYRFTCTGDQLVHEGRFLLHSFELTGDGSNNGVAVIHDGHSTTEETVKTLRCVANESISQEWKPGILLERGVYLDVTNAGEVVITGYPLHP